MSDIIKYGILTDDSRFAMLVSSYLSENNSYVPIISLPRMNRDDWENEVIKRTTAINRLDILILFCKSKDYGILAPFRKYSKVEIIPIKKPKNINKFINLNEKEKYLVNANSDYLLNYIKAIHKNKRLGLKKNQHNNNIFNDIYFGENNSDNLLVLERTGEITDVSAINYAFANNYDIFIINEIKPEHSNEIHNCLIMFSNMTIVSNEDGTINDYNINRLLTFLDKRISYLFNYKKIEKKYNKIQFVTKKSYLGILIKSIPVAHLLHLQSDIHLLNEYYYLNKYSKLKKENTPSCLFVDTLEVDLSSEIPEISENLSGFKVWKFYLNGINANKINFKIFSHFFPYDILLISGHGTSPKARIATFKFKSRNGNYHTAKILEYYQFGRVAGDMVDIELKQYPLEFDSISWRDKKLLKKMNLSHMLLEFVNAKDDTELLTSEEVNTNKIEGIKLFDGVFMGDITSFEIDNNPIIILNSCGSLIEAGIMLNFGMPRVLIGSLWPVLDKSAKSFAISLFNNLNNNSVLNSYHISKSIIEDNYTKYSYIFLGTLNQFISISKEDIDEKIAEENMRKRIIKSIQSIQQICTANKINSNDKEAFIKLIKVCDKFMEDKYPTNFEIREDVRNIRGILDTK